MSKAYLLIVDNKFVAGTYQTVEDAKKASELVCKPATFHIVEFDQGKVEYFYVK